MKRDWHAEVLRERSVVWVVWWRSVNPTCLGRCLCKENPKKVESLCGKSWVDCMFWKYLQLEEAEKRLSESKSKLALLRGVTSASSSHVDAEQVKVERESKIGSFHKSDGSCSSKNHLQSGLRLAHVGSKCSHSVPLPPSSLARVKVKSEKTQTQSISTERESIEVQGRGSKRKVFGILIVVCV